jgi:hypothetical protein
MKLKEITFTDDQEGDAVPLTITVTMSVEEALWVAIVSGKQKGESPHSGIYNCLTSDVFNRYWDDGVSDAAKYMRIETPPIRYDD